MDILGELYKKKMEEAASLPRDQSKAGNSIYIEKKIIALFQDSSYMKLADKDPLVSSESGWLIHNQFNRYAKKELSVLLNCKLPQWYQHHLWINYTEDMAAYLIIEKEIYKTKVETPKSPSKIWAMNKDLLVWVPLKFIELDYLEHHDPDWFRLTCKMASFLREAEAS